MCSEEEEREGAAAVEEKSDVDGGGQEENGVRMSMTLKLQVNEVGSTRRARVGRHQGPTKYEDKASSKSEPRK